METFWFAALVAEEYLGKLSIRQPICYLERGKSKSLRDIVPEKNIMVLFIECPLIL